MVATKPERLDAALPESRVSASRRLPIGAEVVSGGAHFRVWAPSHNAAAVLLHSGGEERLVPLGAEPDGYFSGFVSGAAVGTHYRYRLDEAGDYPDPASRFQPDGPHGPSCIVDPSGFQWTDASWPGVRLEGQVLYEMHVGTFTREGTWEAASAELAELAAAGITVIEMMPVAEFAGNFGWGYDGVDLFAPFHLYGGPDNLRRFVDRAHALGMAVILDVVYNHLGPDGNYLKEFSADYFTSKHENEWGEAINFDGPNASAVREFFCSNAAHWIDEYHMDGLRLDATDTIYDSSPKHILEELTSKARAAARGRRIIVTAENYAQPSILARSCQSGGYGLDALWNDDFHHSAVLAVTGRADAYYADFHGTPQELISAVKYGYLYQGQRSAWRGGPRGTPTRGLRPAQFVIFLENHDQVSNSARGLRLHQLTDWGRLKAITALALLAPGTPLLFQGQEFSASAPFVFFADHRGELGELVRQGRRKYLTLFRSLSGSAQTTDPLSATVFERCKLDFSERERHRESYQFHKDLLWMRIQDPVFSLQGRDGLDGAVLAPEAFLLRWSGERSDDRLLLVNLGPDLRLDVPSEPLLAPPAGAVWKLSWSSEDQGYGGGGVYEPETEQGWLIPGHAALILVPGANPRF